MKQLIVNPWVWTEHAMVKYPECVTGETVPVELLIKGAAEYYPNSNWIRKGFVERQEYREFATELV